MNLKGKKKLSPDSCLDITRFSQDVCLDLHSRPVCYLWENRSTSRFSLAGCHCTWQRKIKKDEVGRWGQERGWPSRVTRTPMFMLRPRRSWWMFAVSKTVQLHLQEHGGQLSVLLPPGVHPAGGRKDVQRWGEPAALVCLFSNVCFLVIRVVAYASPIKKTLLHRKLHQASPLWKKEKLKI